MSKIATDKRNLELDADLAEQLVLIAEAVNQQWGTEGREANISGALAGLEALIEGQSSAGWDAEIGHRIGRGSDVDSRAVRRAEASFEHLAARLQAVSEAGLETLDAEQVSQVERLLEGLGTALTTEDVEPEVQDKTLESLLKLLETSYQTGEETDLVLKVRSAAVKAFGEAAYKPQLASFPESMRAHENQEIRELFEIVTETTRGVMQHNREMIQRCRDRLGGMMLADRVRRSGG